MLRELSVTIEAGSYVVLLGPSGCGKTTLLRIVAGLQRPAAGDVLLDGRSIVHLPPRRRDIAMVFQHNGLYPHQTVLGSIRLPLKGNLSAREIDGRVQQAVRLTRIESILDRYPDRLSGGELRRAAVAKAIARGASVRLLDEPLSALDVPARRELQDDLLRWHGEAPGTTIHVTHDGQEAMRMADQIAVIEAGKIIQFATPEVIYSDPASVTVASSIGPSSINLLTGSLRNGKLQPNDPALSLDYRLSSNLTDRDILVGLRPDTAELTSTGTRPSFVGRVERICCVGSNFECLVSSPQTKLRVLVATPHAKLGDEVTVSWPTGEVLIFDAHTQRRVDGQADRQP